jgi:hypothetical protein
MLRSVTAQTPYDDERRQYSRTALARLVLADEACGLSDAAGNLAVTRYDAYAGAGGRISEASTLIALSERLLTSAVIYERERGSSWEDIGRYLGSSGTAAERRFTPAIDEWRTAFEVPYRLDETGRKRIPQLPGAAYDPKRVSRNLDLWAHVRLGFGDEHAVSGGLDPDADEETTEPVRGVIDGRIRRRHLETFLDLLSNYVRHCPQDGAWNSVVQALEHSSSENPDGWHSFSMTGIFESLNIRIARVSGSDLVSVVVVNANSAELRLRVSTLMDAFERP